MSHPKENEKAYEQIKNHVRDLLDKGIKPIILVGEISNGKSYLRNELRDEGYDITGYDIGSYINHSKRIGKRVFRSYEIHTHESVFGEYILELNTLDEVDTDILNKHDIIDMNHIHF